MATMLNPSQYQFLNGSVETNQIIKSTFPPFSFSTFSESRIFSNFIYVTKIITWPSNARCAKFVFELNKIFGHLSVGQQWSTFETSKSNCIQSSKTIIFIEKRDTEKAEIIEIPNGKLLGIIDTHRQTHLNRQIILNKKFTHRTNETIESNGMWFNNGTKFNLLVVHLSENHTNSI